MAAHGIEARIRDRLAADGAPGLVIESFLRNANRWMTLGRSGTVSGGSLAELGPLPRLEDLDDTLAAREALPHTVIIKLNGGLGTSMGLEQAKSLMVAKNGLSFLDIIVHQIQFLRRHDSAALPLLLMNSFSTDADTLSALESRHPGFVNPDGLPLSFLQHRVPKLDASTGEPVLWPAEPAREWCPPGHADIYHVLQTTGLLDRLLAAGFRYAFVSNADNLGALPHLGILGHLARQSIPFLMEVTDRTDSDRKGGHLARDRATGRLILRESAQCPEDELEDFQDIHRHRFFNTNNLWIDLEALRTMLRGCDGLPELPLIVNRKTVDPTRPDSPAVVQLESAMGSAIACFDQSAALVVPRTRFAPVKTTDDLLAVRSDLYVLGDDFHVSLDVRRSGGPPDIVLDPRFFKHIVDFETRFPHGPPSLLACDSLRVEGDVVFGANVCIEGAVLVRNDSDQPLRINDGARLLPA